MKTALAVLISAILASVAMGFGPPVEVGQPSRGRTALSMTKKYPAGRPVTVQLDEDMAMWFEDKQGNRKKALNKPVEGRPAAQFTKEQVDAIEKKGVSPFEQIGAWVEYLAKRPTRGY